MARLRHLPNVLSGARIAVAPVLVVLAYVQHERLFTWLLLAALVSDIADGLLARRLGLQSALGALLDSVADVATLVAAVVGIRVFHAEVFVDHALACWTVLAGWACVCAVALLRYGRLSSFHTYASKAAGYALGFFLATLFLLGFVGWLFFAAVALSVASSIEELALLWCVPRWRSDVRGLWWVLGARR